MFPVIFYSLGSSFCPLARKLGLQLLCFAIHFCDCIHVYSKQQEQEWKGERGMATTLLVQWYFGFSSSSPTYLLLTFQNLQTASLCILFRFYTVFSGRDSVECFYSINWNFKSWFNQNSDNRFLLSYIPTRLCFIKLKPACSLTSATHTSVQKDLTGLAGSLLEYPHSFLVANEKGRSLHFPYHGLSDIKQSSPKIQVSALESNRAIVVEVHFIPDVQYLSLFIFKYNYGNIHFNQVQNTLTDYLKDHTSSQSKVQQRYFFMLST